ncbi:hypothetical protein AvCA_49430 [Azotobacter vinelandii CA]|uniref:Uncharacterized protein n=2 Tax=Azotobacter vinelandii TaxID=354 RepID=C1DL45_AZOVD|nr:hypothetical protein Avin_49430 [Azotobacter vinelandii DJ]AGK14189.1 hypothetical protein AvCA_49430 [Azotobacter vinelandii CA]AGK22316.1 hypothetical protein AvCA6_49430 [Azotobacter vinelandii CA6]
MVFSHCIRQAGPFTGFSRRYLFFSIRLDLSFRAILFHRSGSDSKRSAPLE